MSNVRQRDWVCLARWYTARYTAKNPPSAGTIDFLNSLDLRNIEARYMDFSGCSLAYLWLEGADFRHSVFDFTDFSFASLRRANFHGATLRNTDLSLAEDLLGANLSGAIVEDDE